LAGVAGVASGFEVTAAVLLDFVFFDSFEGLVDADDDLPMLTMVRVGVLFECEGKERKRKWRSGKER